MRAATLGGFKAANWWGSVTSVIGPGERRPLAAPPESIFAFAVFGMASSHRRHVLRITKTIANSLQYKGISAIGRMD
jgi:hypothetical protein